MITTTRDLKTLNACDVYRDGGSFGAVFTLKDGTGYSLWLARHAEILKPGYSGPRHQYLFENRSWNLPKSDQHTDPIQSFSPEEAEILDALERFLRNLQVDIPFGHKTPHAAYLETLRHMIQAIRHRAVFKAEDIEAYRENWGRAADRRKSEILIDQSRLAQRIQELEAHSGKGESKCLFADCPQLALEGRRLCARHLLE